MFFKYDFNKGNLVINLEGEEKKIKNSERINNVTELYYYPEFNFASSEFNLVYLLYLKNNTLASVSRRIIIKICKENCSCDESNAYCTGCLEDFVNYKFTQNCLGKDDLFGKFLSNGIYYDCYEMCKTCSQYSEGLPDMKCSSCYTERGDYKEGNNCYEKICENLFYFDKDRGIKICLNITICPKEYPIQKENTKQCIQEQKYNEHSSIEDSSIIETQYSLETSNYSENKDSPKTDEISEKLKLNDEESSEISKTEQSSEIQKFEEISDSQKSEEIIETSESEENSEISIIIEENENFFCNYIINLIKEEVGMENIDKINETYSILSNGIKNGNISLFKKDIIIFGVNITYQLTNSESQKNASHNSNVSIIDLGECEKIIKRNISYENDPTPLLILKIDVKKFETKSTAVEYEVYNPYTKEKIDLSICSNTTIAIYAPSFLTDQEISLYNHLDGQGYDLFEANNSFYIDPCTPYTSENGTDVSLKDRKIYYHNEKIVLCEDNCQYIKYYTQNNKAYCKCSVKNSVNVYNDQEFYPQILLENFYKIETYANFEVLFCYKLVFSSKGIKNNICFYILLILLTSFLTSMIINLFSAIKKLEQIIFKIFQDRFMYYFMQKIIKEGRKRRNEKQKEYQQNKNEKGEDKPKPKLNWLKRLKLASNNISPKIKEINLYNLKESENKDEIAIKKGKKLKMLNDSLIKISDSKEYSNKNILNLKNLKKKKHVLGNIIKENNKDKIFNSNNINQYGNNKFIFYNTFKEIKNKYK